MGSVGESQEFTDQGLPSAATGAVEQVDEKEMVIISKSKTVGDLPNSPQGSPTREGIYRQEEESPRIMRAGT